MKWVSYTRTVSSRKGEENPSDVIGRQNAHIETYMREHGFSLSKKYSDRKYSAEEVASFNQMVQDGMKREFDGVVIESVYRCGRDLWTAMEILHETFYPAGIQFAVVEDDFCSVGKTKDDVAEYFARKRSEWISNDSKYKFRKLSENGKFTPAMKRYGLALSEDRRGFEIEEEGAAVVREIYQMFLDGKCFSNIAQELNERGITPPQEHKALKEGKAANVIVPAKWGSCTIRRILESPIYMGKAVHKVKGKEVSYPVPPIVSEETFAAAQKRIEALQRAPREQKWKPTQTSLLFKRIYSKETGNALKSIASPLCNGEKVYVFSKSRRDQSEHYISMKIVHSAVREAICTGIKQARYIDRLMQE
ncbi:MAG: recombinase family protein, partial [Clostridiales bacterium]|nr:recombinase family protein [Clostridiales bacterium]